MRGTATGRRETRQFLTVIATGTCAAVALAALAFGMVVSAWTF